MNAIKHFRQRLELLDALKTRIAKQILFVAGGVFVIAFMVNTVVQPDIPNREIYGKYKSEERMQFEKSLNDYDNLSVDEQKEIDLKRSLYCSLGGYYCNEQTDEIKIADVEDSYVNKSVDFILYPLTNLPISGINSTINAIASAGLVPQTKAYEGFGFQVVSPFRGIWAQMRNAAYAILVIVLILEAFALMFRTSTDPNSALGIEAFVPRIIVVLIMIQFSFAISGFLIDVMYIILLLIYLIFRPLVADAIDYPTFLSSYIFGDPSNLYSFIRTSLTGHSEGWLGALGSYWDIYTTIPGQILNMFGENVGILLSGILTAVFLDKIVEFVGGSKLVGVFKGLKKLGKVGGILATLVAGGVTLTVVPRIVLGMIIFLAIVYVAFKVFITLLRAYIMILILTIFSPFYILMSLVPGNGIGIKSWLKAFISELIVYPIVFATMFGLSAFAATTITVSGVAADLSLPFMPFVNLGFVFVVGVVTVALLPKFIEGIRAMISKSMFSDLEDNLKGSYNDIARIAGLGNSARRGGAKGWRRARKKWKSLKP